MRIISSSANGQLTYCPCRQQFDLEFGNIFLHFSLEELKRFGRYLQAIDHAHFLALNQHAVNRRKIMLQVGADNIFFSLNASEFLELRDLLSSRRGPAMLRNIDVIGPGLLRSAN